MGQHSPVTYKVNIHLSPQHLSREDDLSQAVKRDFLKCYQGATHWLSLILLEVFIHKIKVVGLSISNYKDTVL